MERQIALPSMETLAAFRLTDMQSMLTLTGTQTAPEWTEVR